MDSRKHATVARFCYHSCFSVSGTFRECDAFTSAGSLHFAYATGRCWIAQIKGD
jgi:hypothetical protein